MGDNLATEDEHLRSISNILTGARQTAKALPGFPGVLPKSLDQAYAVQHLSRAAWPDRVAGWKVGGVPPAFLSQFGVARLVGPIFAKNVQYAAAGKMAMMPIFENGFGAIEPEFIIEMGESRDQDRMFIGAEIASSPLPAINDIGPAAVICDFGNNGGLLIGPEIENWQTIAPTMAAIETQIDGEIIGSKVLHEFRSDALEAYAFLIEHATQHDIPLPAGTFVSTGAITGVHEAQIGAISHLDFGQFGGVDLTLIKSQPLG